MYLTILNKNNKPIMSAVLQHFSLHTSACESYINGINYSNKPQIGKCNAVYNVFLKDVEVIDEPALLKFEESHRLDHTAEFSGNHTQENRTFYVFIEPELRDEYSWNITETGYLKRKT